MTEEGQQHEKSDMNLFHARTCRGSPKKESHEVVVLRGLKETGGETCNLTPAREVTSS
jgi:hypothetical protein